MSSRQYHCIGKGFCGSVWALDNDTAHTAAIKREDGGPDRSVTNDYNMHVRILRSAFQTPPSTPLSIPECHGLVQQTDDSWWETRLHQFPAGYTACRALISERIPKIPRSISNKIVDLFCVGNAPLSEFVKQNHADDACLVRPYLGRIRGHYQKQTARPSRYQRFSLRNVPLHLDQMEKLGLDVAAYAETMADALALMHWGAQVDANDVEFVLAPPRQQEKAPYAFQSEWLGDHCLWILDFDCCHPISMDEAGLDKACVAFFKNDPFYPRPQSQESADTALWNVFKERFLVASRKILSQGDRDEQWLAEELVKKIEIEGQLRRSKKEKLDSA
ncbi:hypothetical protein BU24DRAFT_362698 [Aaosphaeria arxii CBS 175.79]|uniref:DUF3669 domain-containing protein n=1 Tax=Aaosphaeria arxii CBS 175.79 TaxID=1450172 RepID=A0A6A5Y8F5_9PLEO|nr:uncharacterized protein BU24DRAFT_362698 [Aaosphaeria arxii CBS 175.79]KAF2021845.1 hypothetical protein BU24DRAFT_362698 [Aaosphaeria arxii CBS 175.79]